MHTNALSHTNTQTLSPHTHTQTLAHTDTHTQTLSLTQTHTHKLSLTHTHTHKLSLTQTHTQTLSLTHTHSYTHTHLQQTHWGMIQFKEYVAEVGTYHPQSGVSLKQSRSPTHKH